MKYCLYDFFDEGTVEIGATNLIDLEYLEDIHADDFNNEDWDFDREVLVNWTTKKGKNQVTEQCAARVVYFSDRRDGDLIKKRDELLVSDEATTSKSTASTKRPLRRPLRFVDDDLDSDTGSQPDEKKTSNSKKVKLAHQVRDKMLLDRLAKKKEQEPMNEKTELSRLAEQNAALQRQLENVMKERDGLVAAMACLKELPELLKKMTAVRAPQLPSCSPLSSPAGMPSNARSSKGDLSPKYASGGNTNKKASQFISDLMVKAFTREEMASHSLTGTSSNANGGKVVKPQINPQKMGEIFDKAASCYPHVDKKVLKDAAKNKLSNERRLVKRSQKAD